jgi:hypothetical protein
MRDKDYELQKQRNDHFHDQQQESLKDKKCYWCGGLAVEMQRQCVEADEDEVYGTLIGHYATIPVCVGHLREE